MNKTSKIYVAGHNGLVGSALCRQLKTQDYENVMTVPHKKLDLRNQKGVDDWFALYRPDYVFLAAAKVGGIGYNKDYPADFIRDNLQIQTNIIESARTHGVKKLCFLASACIYPKHAPVPIKEEYLLTGPLEETNIGYSLAKIAGLVMCKKYYEQYGFDSVSVMPNNLYGINDNFRPSECHVIPSFINRFITAKEKNAPEIICFGDGTPTREFLFSDDMADACIFLMNNHNDPAHINVGPNREVSIKELAEIIANLVGYKGKIVWDTSMPNGTPRRALDTTKMDSLGWKAKTTLEEGLSITIDWFTNNKAKTRH